MRSKIYKAKRKNWRELPKEKWWVEGAVFEGEESSYIITNVKVIDEREDSKIGADVIGYLVDPETICESTDLPDRNGTKIFESDIVSVPMRGYCGKTTNEIGIVEWINGAFSVKWEKEEYGRHFAGYLEDIEVIGNIFDGRFDGKEAEENCGEKGNMERFTEKFKDGRNIIRRGIVDVFHQGFGRFFDGEAVDKLAEYEELEEQGKLLKLPCSTGEAVYRIYKGNELSPDRVYECRVVGVTQEYNTLFIKLHANINEEKYSIWCDDWFDKSQIGYEFFLTKAEAEAALKELSAPNAI